MEGKLRQLVPIHRIKLEASSDKLSCGKWKALDLLLPVIGFQYVHFRYMEHLDAVKEGMKEEIHVAKQKNPSKLNSAKLNFGWWLSADIKSVMKRKFTCFSSIVHCPRLLTVPSN